MKKEELNEEERKWEFNDGRLSCDDKWMTAIDKRIEELEIQVGIPELRRLRKSARYRWKNDEVPKTDEVRT